MASFSSENSESNSEGSTSSPTYSSSSDVLEAERSLSPDHGVIQPYMYEPVASGESDSDRDDDGDSEPEERRDNTDWYRYTALFLQ